MLSFVSILLNSIVQNQIFSTETDNKVYIKTDVKDILSDVLREICIHEYSIGLHAFKYNSPLYIIGTEWIQKQISTLIKG